MTALLFSAALLGLAPDPFAQARARMMEDLNRYGIRDKAVLAAMRNTPRHEFVPPLFRRQAYRDGPLPIGHGATISQPYIVAFMTELLEVKPTHKVLEIGTGSGYQAAILGRLAASVHTVEIIPELARSSAATLARLGHRNVLVRQGDGYKGWPDEAPFDRIILTAAPPDVPQALIDQLAPGGRLVAPVGVRSQELQVVDKSRDGKIVRRPSIPVTFVPMVPGR